ncbi:hypothetical protein E5161_12805 [Cohnella pontilimi]|uniref:Uncharacterized protein n=1 Tax=Cohnella pontilimi TaxID=2564100 RepID=A0A4U0F969_9BACL|nr:hypothetical protein [Cohnella pontilimi]TJY41303.1 hypothetical protein E5161_12805 [Cohnella pontilimi]
MMEREKFNHMMDSFRDRLFDIIHLEDKSKLGTHIQETAADMLKYFNLPYDEKAIKNWWQKFQK